MLDRDVRGQILRILAYSFQVEKYLNEETFKSLRHTCEISPKIIPFFLTVNKSM